MDRENVIKGLEEAETMLIQAVDRGGEMAVMGAFKCLNRVTDALVMLKKQKAIVRCKDCINCIKEPNGELYCDILAVGYEPLGSKKVNEDWYCADGERLDCDG